MKTPSSQHGWLMVEVLLTSTILAFSLAAAVRWQQNSHLSAADTRERSYALQWASSVAQCLQANAHANNTSTCFSDSSQVRAGITYQLQLSSSNAGEGLTDWDIAITWPARHAHVGESLAGQLHLYMRTGSTAIADGVSLP
jgi:Tfp pilus assembly protein PilV